MQLTNDAGRWGAIAQAFHWLIAAAFIGMVALGMYMEGLPQGPWKFEVYAFHKALGVTILALAVLRLGWRLVNRTPEDPPTMAGWERLAARATHIGLYGVIFAQPVTGILFSQAANFPVNVFGLFTLPTLIGKDEALAGTLQAVHFWIGWVIVALIVVHAGAALRHHFVKRDAVLRRMLPGG